MQEQIDIIDNVIQAISILNKTDKYLGSLNDRLSECDKLETDYRHIIEFTPIEKVDLNKLYIAMQNNFNNRRKIKNDFDIGKSLSSNIAKLNNPETREFLIQTLKNAKSKNDNLEYTNRVLSDEQFRELMINEEKRKRGRPRKNQEQFERSLKK